MQSLPLRGPGAHRIHRKGGSMRRPKAAIHRLRGSIHNSQGGVSHPEPVVRAGGHQIEGLARDPLRPPLGMVANVGSGGGVGGGEDGGQGAEGGHVTRVAF
eukprot:458708-Prorocentrum_minimum.AAC.1